MNNIFGPNRQSIRLREYDYTSEGAYFVTICTENRLMLFGEIKNKTMELSLLGEMIQKAWQNIVMYDPRISLDEFMVMPDHFHGIVLIDRMGWERDVTGLDGVGSDIGMGRHGGRGWYPAPTISLAAIIGRFKSWTTYQYRRYLERDGLPAPLDTCLWQRNYYERIMRNEKEMNNVREYIRNNPKNWNPDSDNTIHYP